jgi:hypothetical protein
MLASAADLRSTAADERWPAPGGYSRNLKRPLPTDNLQNHTTAYVGCLNMI